MEKVVCKNNKDDNKILINRRKRGSYSYNYKISFNFNFCLFLWKDTSFHEEVDEKTYHFLKRCRNKVYKYEDNTWRNVYLDGLFCSLVVILSMDLNLVFIFEQIGIYWKVEACQRIVFLITCWDMYTSWVL